MTITVASYNIHKSVGSDGQRRPERIFSVLAELDADIVALQEVDRRFGARATTFEAEQLEHATGYRLVRHAVRPLSSGWHGNAVLVRGAIEPLHGKRITLPALEPRGALMVDLDVGAADPLRIVAAHLGLIGRFRKRQAEAILEALATDERRLPTVVMGDLNEWSARGGCLRVFSQKLCVNAPGPSFPARRPLFGLDRIITSDDVEVVRTGVHHTATAREASDHLPVTAELRLPEEAQALSSLAKRAGSGG